MNKFSEVVVMGIVVALLVSGLFFLMYFSYHPDSDYPLKMSQVGETNGVLIIRVEQGKAVGFIGVDKHE